MKRSLVVHPVLWAVCPVLFLYAHNATELSLNATAVPLALSVLLAAVVWALASLRWKDYEKGGVYTSVILLWFFLYGHLYNKIGLTDDVFHGWPYLFFVLWTALLVAFLFLLGKVRCDMRWLSEPLNVASVVMLVFLVVPIVKSELARQASSERPLPAETKMPAITRVPKKLLPNIYFIILDSYARADILQRYYQLDNTDFLTFLRKRGFYVAERSQSNYSQTIDSIPATLNATYLDQVAAAVGKNTGDRTRLGAMVREPLVANVLRRYGYKVVAFPSEYDLANMRGDVNMRRLEGTPDFYDTVINTTPLLLLSLTARDTEFDPYAKKRQRLLWQFNNIPLAARRRGPLFVYAHIQAPHPPYVFDEHGNPVKANPQEAIRSGRHWRESSLSPEEEARRYRSEVIFINKRTKRMIQEILTHSDRKTIIVIQGDHGPGYLPNENDPSLTDIYERFSILNACLLPEGGARHLYPEITPVNTFRLIFKHYLKMDYALLPDRHYFTGFAHPYDFIDVTAQLKKAHLSTHPLQTVHTGGDD